MKSLHRLFAISFFLLVLPAFVSSVVAQQVTWGFRTGGTATDYAQSAHVDQSGNVYTVGEFSGTNVDFDPGPATVLRSSNGLGDGYLTKYDANGQLLLCITFGGSSRDRITSVATDAANNIYVTGHFRNANVDFDPSPATYFLSSIGQNGTDNGFGGDIFVAKYTSTGQLLWAFNIGSQFLDGTGAISVNNLGEIYIGGFFRDNMDLDPGGGTTVINGATGTVFLAKYNSNGGFLWGFNFGLGGNEDNTINDLEIDAAGNVIASGFFQGTGIDFDPGPGTAILSSAGTYEGYVAKYNTSGQYQWAFKIGGAQQDVARGLVIDNVGDIYVTGDFQGSNVDFDPGPGTALRSSNGSSDIFLAKYSASGQYQWAISAGSGGNEYSWEVSTDNSSVYIAGWLTSTADFDPGPATDNLTSNGGFDIVLAEYDLAGNYRCAFNIGSAADDFGWDIKMAGNDQFYLVGGVQGINVDFAPTQSTHLLSSAGLEDIFLVKYYWPQAVAPAGTLQGSSVCTGDYGTLTFNATAGVGPFTITFSDGVTTYTQSNVQSGVPFTVTPAPTATTTYTLLTIRDAMRCNVQSAGSGTATINMDVLNFDFSYQQDICDPLSVQFTGTGNSTSNPRWWFGDNTTAAVINPLHVYAAQGTYTVQYSVTGANGCSDTITKIIPIIITRDNVVLTRDTTICAGTTKQLLAAPALAYCWTPSTYLSNPNIQNPVTSAPGPITYFLTTESTGTNLVVNGDFSAGNTGFTSQYVYTTPNLAEAQYYVSANANAWNGAMQNCPDHTTGTGNMMLVNGSPNANDKIWSQTITITPNTNYAFSTWVQSLNNVNAARLKFSINNNVIGNNIAAAATPCQWNRFYTTWNSGSNTTATITIVNNNTAASGNDFALDDISFTEVFIKRDSVIITVDTPSVRTTDDLAVCSGTPVQLNTTGAQTYVWNASSTLSNVNIPDPVATPTVTTQYIVAGTNANGCVAKDTVNINVHTRPTITVTDDAQVCRNGTIQLSATGGLSYLWTPPATLDNPASATPIAAPTADTWYYVDVTDNNTCTWRDSVLVTLRPEPVFTLTPASAQICAGQSVQLQAGGGTSYSWTPSTGMSDPNIANPTVTPAGTTTYTVLISEGVCNRSQSFSTTVTVERPVVVTSDNTTICKGTSVQFNTTGAQNYSWNQPGSLNSPSIPDPVATPTAPTQYIVTGTTATGCTARDTVNVDFYPDPLITTTDDADICRNASIQLSTTGGVSYAWTPSATLSNPSIANPVAAPSSSTIYYVDITDVNNCVHRDSVKVNIRPDAVFSLDAAAPVCLGNTIQLNASGGDTYSWQASPTLSNTGIPDPVASPAATETYFVTISESFCGHSETLSTTVRVNPLPTIQVNKSNDIDCSYDRAQLSATGAMQYVWSPAGTLSSATIANPVATPTSTTDYTVTATDANGCVNTGTVTVKVEAINEGKYLMANGFTPNGDGLNDCYGVKLWGIVQEIEFSIYNRWGERVFYSTQPSACWDGTYKGLKQDSGVFVYMIKAKTICAPSVFRKGTFVLIR